VDATAWATVALVAVTGALVWTTWLLRKTTQRDVEAGERAAAAALRQAELSSEAVQQARLAADAAALQAEMSRKSLEASVAPLLVPIGEAHDAPDVKVLRAPVTVERTNDSVVVTIRFRNYGRGPARVAGCNIVAEDHSYHGAASPMVVAPRDDTVMIVDINASDDVTDAYAAGRESVLAGRFRVGLSCWNLPQTTIYTTEIFLYPRTLTGRGPHQWDVKITEAPGEPNALIRTMLHEGYIPGVAEDDRGKRGTRSIGNDECRG
jgi:hypothetical protein